MENICLEHGYDERYVKMAKAQDSIGWRRFMEGMVSKEMWNIQRTHASVLGMRHNTERWGVELVTRLLEVTHGQWLYATFRYTTESPIPLLRREKKNFRWRLNGSESWGRTGYWRKIAISYRMQPGDLEETSVMKETYWLLAIKAAS